MKSVIVVLLLLGSIAEAQTESAQDRFTRGAALYEATRYEAALHEFEAAHAMKPMAAFVFNIARCLDRLDRRDEAKAAYQRFLSEDPEALTAPVARERLALISAMDEVPPATPAPVVLRRRYVAPVAIGGGALALLAVGAGLLGSAVQDFNALEKSCAPVCSTSSWSGIRTRELAGEVVLGVGAAAAVADIIVFAVEYGRRKK